MSEAPEQSARETGGLFNCYDGFLTVMTEFGFEGSGHDDFRRGLEATRRAQQAPWRQVPEHAFWGLWCYNLKEPVIDGLRRGSAP